MPLRNKPQRTRLDTEIEVYNNVLTDADDFSKTETQTLVATVMSNVTYPSRKQVERIIAAQQTSIQQVVFTIRRPREYTVTKPDTIKIVGETGIYDVISIIKDIGRNQYWDIVTELKD